MAVSKQTIQNNLSRIGADIADACARSRRDVSAVSLVAVTKTVGDDEIAALLSLGVTELGESRVPQLLERAEHTQRLTAAGKAPPARWHMIGHLQRNKVKGVMAAAGVIHSVDSLRLAEDINTRAEQENRRMDVLLQVNCSQEPQKHGVAVGAARHLAELLSNLRNLRLVGLMTMAPLVADAEAARPTFVRLREIFEEMRHDGIGGADFRELSMGMSNDYAVAVQEGATIVRIGTALFA
jgi:pyridoxal phosphate enzyme (YggS family)